MRLGAKRVIIIWAVVLLLPCFLIILPKYNRLAHSKAALELKFNRVLVQHQIELLSAELKMWPSRVPQRFPGAGEQLVWLHQTTARCNLCEEKFELKKTQTKKSKKSIHYQLQLVGRYQDVLCWLQVLAVQQNTMQLKLLQLKAAGQHVNVSVTLVTS